MQTIKIVISGAYSAGKSSFIRAVSDIDVVSTEAAVTQEEERLLKAETTVGLDFGTIAINDDLALYLFGTPGQERFDYMWEILSEGCIGYVVLVDSCRPGHLAETRRLIDRFSVITAAPFVVAANKQDDPTALPPTYIRRRLGLPAEIPVLPCTTTSRDDVKQVLLALLEHIEVSEASEKLPG
jgi:uncharacterized protein